MNGDFPTPDQLRSLRGKALEPCNAVDNVGALRYLCLATLINQPDDKSVPVATTAFDGATVQQVETQLRAYGWRVTRQQNCLRISDAARPDPLVDVVAGAAAGAASSSVGDIAEMAIDAADGLGDVVDVAEGIGSIFEALGGLFD